MTKTKASAADVKTKKPVYSDGVLESRDKEHAHVIVHSTPVHTEIISKRAYELFQQRGCAHGFDIMDWVEAERQLAEEALS